MRGNAARRKLPGRTVGRLAGHFPCSAVGPVSDLHAQLKKLSFEMKEPRMTEPLLAAFAEVDITPAVETTQNGKRRRRSFTVHDPLMARLCVLRQGEQTAVLAGIDVFELGGGFEERVSAHLAGTGLDSESLLFSPSHVGMSPISHYGAYIIVFAQDLIINDFEAECASRIAGGIREALDQTHSRCASPWGWGTRRNSPAIAVGSNPMVPWRWWG